MDQPVVTIGRRTRIRAGREADYASLHALIPADVESALRRCGILRWHIWIDGATLFHSIDTTSGYQRFLDEITAIGPVNPAWDELVGALLESEPSADQVLPLVWALDGAGQHSPAAATPPA